MLMGSTKHESECGMIDFETFCEPEWIDWYRLTPEQRWAENQQLWRTYLALGGTLDPEPDTQSPFFDAAAPCAVPADGRAGVRVIRRSGV
jgi:hypothetical protein